ncbi:MULTISPECIES: YbaK/EbsC family protein [Gluconobacter]|uniref:Cys-tRNA(Pro)/cys-tRNA(Cys) deacylase n=1 Tax=Gluconobacter albidus TaxID=318683 RepID=A0A149TIG4_9PROT|nr:MULTISPECIES: YbaK/EbsC family protein [Gluconobacter]AQS89643.1 cys-tRNA(pro)/cys-tRNA(cys) deacylase [Gluconobacter albidus]KXV36962.1 prolyl-tRNA synthetase [Gluconobacter albidus]KXV47873.1 prolyl-tRNA synthetase [Gluconobacter albidus]MBS1027027.1 YbaK/EbsC family protein [Gluconobacter albidus]MCP1274319.1 YbaK/EbsC family protein [Gluconobacter albidus]
MSRSSVQAFFEANAPDIQPVVLEDSTATVAEAAQTLGVQEGQIAKTLALKVGEERILVVMAGTGRLDNRKTKDTFGNRPRMLPADEVLQLTSHPVGGVCPFGLPQPVRVFCDISLRAFDNVWPAAGDRNSSVCLTPDRLAELVSAEWVDVTQT